MRTITLSLLLFLSIQLNAQTNGYSVIGANAGQTYDTCYGLDPSGQWIPLQANGWDRYGCDSIITREFIYEYGGFNQNIEPRRVGKWYLDPTTCGIGDSTVEYTKDSALVLRCRRYTLFDSVMQDNYDSTGIKLRRVNYTSGNISIYRECLYLSPGDPFKLRYSRVDSMLSPDSVLSYTVSYNIPQENEILTIGDTLSHHYSIDSNGNSTYTHSTHERVDTFGLLVVEQRLRADSINGVFTATSIDSTGYFSNWKKSYKRSYTSFESNTLYLTLKEAFFRSNPNLLDSIQYFVYGSQGELRIASRLLLFYGPYVPDSSFFPTPPGDSTVGIAQISAPDIRLFANPTQGIVHVQSAQDIQNITLYSSTGKQLSSTPNISGKSGRVDLKDLPRGICFLQLRTAEGVHTKQVIKN
jgi:hypothetical protein